MAGRYATYRRARGPSTSTSLFIGTRILDTPDLTIPHPRLSRTPLRSRASVEFAPDLRRSRLRQNHAAIAGTLYGPGRSFVATAPPLL